MFVQFRDSVDIVASPIMLEGLQQCVDSLTPTFEVSRVFFFMLMEVAFSHSVLSVFFLD